MENEPRIAEVIGSMPPYYEVAYALWGRGVDFDSDGDSNNPESTAWREFAVIRRPENQERVDIDPLPNDVDTLNIRASSPDLLDRACAYLVSVGAVKIKA